MIRKIISFSLTMLIIAVWFGLSRMDHTVPFWFPFVFMLFLELSAAVVIWALWEFVEWVT
jgi:hypothetical protein